KSRARSGWPRAAGGQDARHVSETAATSHGERLIRETLGRTNPERQGTIPNAGTAEPERRDPQSPSSDLKFTRGGSPKILGMARAPASALPARPSLLHRCNSRLHR